MGRGQDAPQGGTQRPGASEAGLLSGFESEMHGNQSNVK